MLQVFSVAMKQRGKADHGQVKPGLQWIMVRPGLQWITMQVHIS